MAEYSLRPLAAKLGIKPDTEVILLGGPPAYAAMLGELPAGVKIQTHLPSGARFIHLFARLRIELEAALPRAAGALADNGMLWVSWPTQAARFGTDLTEDIARTIALPLRLVDVEACAVDEVWSALKFVRRQELRG